MRKHFPLLCAALFLAACSSPRYTYNFDYYDYNSGKAKQVNKFAPLTDSIKVESPLALRGQDFLVSTSFSAGVSEEAKMNPISGLELKADSYRDMSKKERRDFRRDLRTQIKSLANEFKSRDDGATIAATKELDDELKLAIIFGAVGITLVVLGGINTIFWVLGVAGLVIGLVFFIRWISTQ